MKKKHQQVRVASEQILPMRARRQILGNTISNSFKVFRNFRVRLKKTILITKVVEMTFKSVQHGVGKFKGKEYKQNIVVGVNKSKKVR
jgi:hypothetical protein